MAEPTTDGETASLDPIELQEDDAESYVPSIDPTPTEDTAPAAETAPLEATPLLEDAVVQEDTAPQEDHTPGEQVSAGEDAAPVVEDESDEDYDPSNLIPGFETMEEADLDLADGASQATSKLESTKSPAAVTKRRTVGGFAVESSDEEEEHSKQSQNEHLNVPEKELQAAEPISDSTDIATPLPDLPNDNTALDQGVVPVASPTSTQVPISHNVSVPSNEGVVTQAPVPAQPLPTNVPNGTASATSADPATAAASVLPKARLPSDTVGMLEDRVAEDPRGDLEAWQDLISEYRKRNKIEEARNTYDRFFEVFPTAAGEWLSYVRMELDADARVRVDQIYNRSLPQTFSLELWKSYLDYVRRTHNIDTDTTGEARKTILKVFNFVLQSVGMELDAGSLWQEYIAFVKSGPGTLGGQGWQDLQKTDEVRKVYQRAIIVPSRASTDIWQDYQRFENEFNKSNARRVLQEISPSFVTARSAAVHLASLLKPPLQRSTLPKLPPALDHEGYVEYMDQLRIWQNIIAYEKTDPLNVKEDDVGIYQSRVIFMYKQALMAFQFWPKLWFEAAEFCFQNSLKDQALTFLQQGANATPESLLLAFKLADQIEDDTATQLTSSDEANKLRMQKIRQPYDKALDALYSLYNKVDNNEKQLIARATEQAQTDGRAVQPVPKPLPAADVDMDEEQEDLQTAEQQALEAKIKIIKGGAAIHKENMKQVITSVWVALMRSARRVQGKGTVSKDNPSTGLRAIFGEARLRGRTLGQLYVEAAQLEWNCYQDPAAWRIFDRGLRLHYQDEKLALEYMKLLVAKNDPSNARHVFETAVGKLTASPADFHKAKLLFQYIHQYDSQFGGLKQVQATEARMAKLWPEDPKLELFSARFKTPDFDPAAYVPIISAAAQLRPVMRPTVSIEEPPAFKGSPRTGYLSHGAISSPKRSFNNDDSDNELLPPRKILRGDSPLKGAAGRRIDASRRHGHAASVAAAPPLAPQIQYLFRNLPDATTFIEHTGGHFRINVDEAIQLLRNADLSRANLTPMDQRNAQ